MLLVVTQQQALLVKPGNVCISPFGEATRDALLPAGVKCKTPAEPRSEGLLALAELLALQAGDLVWIIGGEGGRQVLQDELANREVRALKFEFYRRMPADLPASLMEVDLVEVSSATSLKLVIEAVRNRYVISPVDLELVVITVSERLADMAASAGFKQVVTATGADAAAVVGVLAKAVNKVHRGK